MEPSGGAAGPPAARSRHSWYAALALGVAGLVAPRAACAHDLWVERAGDGFVLRYGHRGEDLPIDAAKVRTILCWDGARPAKDVRSTARFSIEAVRFPGPCAAVSVLHDGGVWSLTPDGEVNLPRSEVANAVRSWTSRQYAKWVDARSAAARAVLADELEIVPVTDLARAREGDKVTLRVLAAGEPVQDAVVAVAHRAVGETDSKGEIRLRLRPGVASVSTSIRRPAATPAADTEVLEASLTFEVAR